MINFIKNNVYCNDCGVIISQDLGYTVVASGKNATNALYLAKSAPTIRKIRYQSSKTFLHEKNFSGVYDVLKTHENAVLDNAKIALIIKELQAQYANTGMGLVTIFGLRLNGDVKLRDMGFEHRFDELNSVFLDFGYCGKAGYQQNSIGYDMKLKNYITRNDNNLARECGTFHINNNEFTLDANYIPQEISSLVPGIKPQNINLTPNLDYILLGLYTNLSEDSLRIYEFDEDDVLSCSFACGLVDGDDLAIALRERGARIYKAIVTSDKAKAGMSSVASAVINSADTASSLKRVLLTNTTANGFLEAESDYILYRRQFIDGKIPDNTLQNNIMYAADNSIGQLANVNVVTSEKLSELVEDLFSLQVSTKNNEMHHKILDEGGRVIGYISSNGLEPLKESLSNATKLRLNKIQVEDVVFDKSEVRNMTVDALNQESTKQSLEEQLEFYIQKSRQLNVDAINFELADIDEKCSKTYQTLSSLIASATLSAAQSATLLEMANLLLGLELQEAYTGTKFGLLSQCFEIKKTSDGGSQIEIIESVYNTIPLMRKVTTKQCGVTYTINNGSPGNGKDSYLNLGATLAARITDCQGNFVSHEKKKFEISPAQYRGEGKSRQEVVPFRETEERVVVQFGSFLNQMKQFLMTILNDEKIKMLAKIQDSIINVSDALKEFNSRRKPFQDQLMSYLEYTEQVFFLQHSIDLINHRFGYSDGLHINSDLQYMESAYAETLNNKQISYVNSITDGLNIEDHFLSKDIVSQGGISEKLKTVNTKLGKLLQSCADITYINDFTKELIETVKSSDKFNEEEKIEIGKMTVATEDKVIPINCKIKPQALKDGILQEAELNLKQGEISLTQKVPTKEFLDHINNIASRLGLEPLKAKTIDIELFKEIDALADEYFANVSSVYERILAALEENKITFQNQPVNIKENKFTIENEVCCITYNVSRKAFVGEDELDTSDYSDLLNIEGAKIKTTVDIEDVKFIRDFDLDLVIFCGNLVYDLRVLLEHDAIFGNVPHHPEIEKKIKYALFQETETDNTIVTSELVRLYGEFYGNQYARYVAKAGYQSTIFSLVTFACISNIELFITLFKAFSDEKLGTFLTAKNLPESSAQILQDQIMSLFI